MSDRDQLASRIGEVVRTVTMPIEAGKVAEFARAIKDPAPEFFDAAAAQAAGFEFIPCPPTFTLAATLYASGDAADLPRLLGLDLSRVVHGEQSCKFHRTPVVGDVLTGISRISSVSTRNNRVGLPMRMVTIKTEFTDAQGRRVVDEDMLMIELPEKSTAASDP